MGMRAESRDTGAEVTAVAARVCPGKAREKDPASLWLEAVKLSARADACSGCVCRGLTAWKKRKWVGYEQELGSTQGSAPV